MKNFKLISALIASSFVFSAYAHECPTSDAGYACHDAHEKYECPTATNTESGVVYLDCMPQLGAKADPLCGMHSSCFKFHCPNVERVW